MADIHDGDIGVNIREQRKKKCISLADLGVQVGVSGQAIYQYESGKRSIKFDMIEKIANALDVPVETLLGSHTFVSGKSKKVKALPLRWATVLNLKELLLPNGAKDEEMEGILQDHNFQMFLYGLFSKLKKLDETDRYIILQLLNEIVDKDISVDELESINIVTSRLYSLNSEGIAHANRLIEDISELSRYKKTI